ncbi:MAG TPA: hypothetical protein VMV18_12695 [bacterium]|nr:hypothetical protein [bacterium]
MGFRIHNLVIAAALLACAAASRDAAAATRSSSATTLDYGDAMRIGNEAARDWAARQPVATAVQVQLQAEGVSDAETAKTLAAIDRRAGAELRRFGTTLEGKIFTADELRAAIAGRERVIRFDAQSSPRAYAAGRPLTWVVSDAEAARLARGLAATWIERQAPLREKVKELVTLEDITEEDVPALQAYARYLTLEHARERILSMRGAGFFSADDAQRFVDEAFDEKIDEIRIEKLSEPVARSGFLDDARAHYSMGADETSAGLNLPRDTQHPAIAGRRAAATAHAGTARN